MSAIISSCGNYRYQLTRPSEVEHPDTGPALFVMLNPSRADASQDDPTIRRCRGFARTWGGAGMVVANLYAMRSPYPDDLWRHPDPVGPENDDMLRLLAGQHRDVVCAWGARARPERVREVMAIFKSAGARLWCLGVTKYGHPRHPLFVRGDQPLVPWAPPEGS